MGILAELRERMLVNWTLPETPETDPTTTVTQRGWVQTTGVVVPQQPLGGVCAFRRGSPFLVLHRLVRRPLGVLHRDPPQLGLDPQHCSPGVLHQSSHQVALNPEVRRLVGLHREPQHFALSLEVRPLVGLHREPQHLALNLEELAGELNLPKGRDLLKLQGIHSS